MSFEKKADGKAMTLAEIKDFIAKADLLELPPDTQVKGEVRIGSSYLKKLVAG